MDLPTALPIHSERLALHHYPTRQPTPLPTNQPSPSPSTLTVPDPHGPALSLAHHAVLVPGVTPANLLAYRDMVGSSVGCSSSWQLRRLLSRVERIRTIGVDIEKLSRPGESVKYRLAVLNGLNQSRFGSLPKPLRSDSFYRVRLRIIP